MNMVWSRLWAHDLGPITTFTAQINNWEIIWEIKIFRYLIPFEWTPYLQMWLRTSISWHVTLDATCKMIATRVARASTMVFLSQEPEHHWSNVRTLSAQSQHQQKCFSLRTQNTTEVVSTEWWTLHTLVELVTNTNLKHKICECLSVWCSLVSGQSGFTGNHSE